MSLTSIIEQCFLICFKDFMTQVHLALVDLSSGVQMMTAHFHPMWSWRCTSGTSLWWRIHICAAQGLDMLCYCRTRTFWNLKGLLQLSKLLLQLQQSGIIVPLQCFGGDPQLGVDGHVLASWSPTVETAA